MSRAVLAPFESYQKSRVTFVQTVAELATRPQNIEALQSAGVMALLRPLLLDNVPSIQQSAALALGRLANYSDELAEAVVSNEILPQLVYSLSEQNKAAAYVLRSVAKHSPHLAKAVVNSGALDALVNCLEEFDPSVKEAAAWALACINLIEAEIFPRILNCLKDMDVQVRKNAATCIREIAKQTTELAKLIVHSGGAAATVDYISESKGNARLPGIMTLGYISAFDDSLAMAVIVSKGIAPLKDALISEPEDHLKAAAAWSLGQIGRHSPDHAKFLAEADVPSRLLAVYMLPESSKDLKDKAKKALKNIIQMCTHLPALEPLLQLAPNNILTYVCAQFAKVLPQNLEAKRTFVQSGGFQKIQEIQAEPGSKLREYIDEINSHYPPDVVNYYSPNYADGLIKRLEEYHAE